jgi:hypothetical protein
MLQRSSRLVVRLALFVVSGLLMVAFAAPVAAADPGYTTIVDGLRNPRGIDFSADGKLYVAESGEAGDVCFTGIPTEEGGTLCAGLSSRISRVDVRAHTRRDYITGLVSVGGPLFAIGASGLGVRGNQVFGLMGFNDIAIPPAEACGGGSDCQMLIAKAKAQLGHLLRGVTSRHYRWKQDVGAFNYNWTVAHKATIGAGNPDYQPGWADNPDFQPGDANPYALADVPSGSYMVDGGSNTLTWIGRNGRMRVVAAFPQPNPPASAENPVPYDAVPTCVAPVGKKVVVSDLHGRIFVVNGRGTNQTVAASTVTSVGGAFLVAAGGCASDGHGHVYISDIFAGSLVKLTLGSMTLSWVRPPSTLNFPAGVAVRGGSIYVANNGVCPSFPTPPSGDPANPNPCEGVTGSIVRIVP